MVDLYSKPSISGYNSSPPSDDDSQTSANAVSWAKHINKIGGPLKTYIDAVNDAIDGLADDLFGNAVTALSSDYSLTIADYGKTLKTSNAITLTLLTGSGAGGNFVFSFYNSDSSNNLTIGRNGVNINGAASNLTIYPKQAGIAFSDGTDWWIMVIPTPDSTSTISGNWTHSGTLTMSGKSMYWAKGTDIASAATLVLGSDGNMFDVTGSTGPITAITVPAGMLFMLQFDSTPTLTHHATNLNLPGSADIVAAAGDRLIGFATAANTVHIIEYTKASGKPVTGANVSGTAQATTSGTAWEYTSIPSWVTEIQCSVYGFSTNGSSLPIIQIGDSGGYEITGYSGSSGNYAGTASTSLYAGSGFEISPGVAAGESRTGVVTLTLADAASNTWVAHGNFGRTDAGSVSVTGGSKALSGVLDRIRLTMTNGTDVGDAGAFNILYR